MQDTAECRARRHTYAACLLRVVCLQAARLLAGDRLISAVQSTVYAACDALHCRNSCIARNTELYALITGCMSSH